MERIVIVEAVSTGYNYVIDCLERGYEPVVLETLELSPEMEAEMASDRKMCYAMFPLKVRTLHEERDYEKTLAEIRALKPILVVAGSENGVVLAMRLSSDLGLPGNPYENHLKLVSKKRMQEALKEYGIRCIRGREVSTEEEALAWYREIGTEDVVVKPIRGAGSENVYLCHGSDQMLNAFRESLGKGNSFASGGTSVLIQERIFGTEYVVNTLSCKGKHRLASMWRYEKKRISEGNNAYVGAISVKRLTSEQEQLVRYAYQVLEALQVQYGPVHGEYMIDKNGPVLIEVNCRVMGANMPGKFIQLIFGHHETDAALDSYLNPHKFEMDRLKPYRPARVGIIKFFYSTEAYALRSSPIVMLLPHLKSYFSGRVKNAGMNEEVNKTTNLENKIGTAYLVHNDESIVMWDYEKLCRMESEYFHLLYESASEREANKEDESDVEDYVASVMRECEKLRLGETVTVTAKECERYPYGLRGRAMLFELGGLTLEAPQGGETDVLRATKE